MSNTIWKNNSFLLRFSEQARSKAAAENKLTEEQEVRIGYLIKLFYYRDFTDYAWGWKASCRKGLNKPIKVRLNKKAKFLSSDDICEILYEEWEDTLQKYHNMILEDIAFDRGTYANLPVVQYSNFSNFRKFFKEYCLIVADILAKGDYISAKENSDILDRLLEKFPIEED